MRRRTLTHITDSKDGPAQTEGEHTYLSSCFVLRNMHRVTLLMGSTYVRFTVQFPKAFACGVRERGPISGKVKLQLSVILAMEGMPVAPMQKSIALNLNETEHAGRRFKRKSLILQAVRVN